MQKISKFAVTRSLVHLTRPVKLVYTGNRFSSISYKAEEIEGRRAAHCMFWSKTQSTAIGNTPMKALIMMQVRFDGLLGFPGGLVDEGESVEQGLNRELEEEINLNLDEVKITKSDLISIQRPTVNDEDPNLVCYFYAKELTEAQFKDIERRQLDAVEWGKECFGIIRVPLFRLKNHNPIFEKDYPSKGFGWYLSNSFVSIARSQMLESIIKLEIMTEEEVKEALEGGENERLRIDYANK